MQGADGHDHGRHAGEIELKKLGHLLLAYLPTMGGRVRPPRYLAVDERPLRGVDTCTLCGVTVSMGDFSVRNHSERRVDLPFLAVHALVTHGERTFHGALVGDGRIDVDRLKDALNYEEYRLGRLITGLLAHTSLLPGHLTIDEHMLRSVVPCGECGDPVNRGHFVITNNHNEARLEVPYLALHALVEHKDLDYGSRPPGERDPGESDPGEVGEAIEGRLDVERLRAVLGQSRAHVRFGQRIAATLRALHADEAEAPAPHLDLRERPAGAGERCLICDAVIDAGDFELRNVHTGHEMLLAYLAIHSLAAHGDAYFRGELRRGWVDVPLLARLVKRTWPVVQRVRVEP